MIRMFSGQASQSGCLDDPDYRILPHSCCQLSENDPFECGKKGIWIEFNSERDALRNRFFSRKTISFFDGTFGNDSFGAGLVTSKI